MNRANLGHTGEAVAAKYYIRQGYLLLNHNYRTRMGELDLILYKADTIVFAEVKTRTSAQRAEDWAAECWGRVLADSGVD